MERSEQDAALRDAYRDRLLTITAVRRAFESSDATDYERDFLAILNGEVE